MRCHTNRIILFLFAACAATLMSGPALAQLADAGSGMLPEIDVRGQGWSQLSDPEEMIEFGIGVLELLILTSLIAFHPIRLAASGARSDTELPKTLFSYALVGMVVGFLVMNHGYLIGFVVFGLGGLLRFRSDADSTGDTRRLLIVTLIGLCIGLDLPVMGAILAVSSWLIIYFLSVKQNLVLHVKFSEKENVRECMGHLRMILEERGFKTVSMHKSGFKPVAEFALINAGKQNREDLLSELTGLHEKKEHHIVDWYIE